MRREAQFFVLLLALAVIAACTACRHKPAYDEIDANRSSSAQNRNGESQAGAGATPGGEPSPTAGQPAPSTPPTQSFKTPRFLDPVNGIKDLPSYPRAARFSVRIGPNEGLNVMTLGLRTSDSMDAIASYYQRVIRDNNWTVVTKTLDSEMSEWLLQKGDDNSAKIQVRKEPTGKMNILVVRGEKLEETKK